MTSMPHLLAFGGVVLLGAMSPGPDFAVVVRRSAVSGRHRGMAAALGIAAGVFVWAVAAAAGVAALVAASALAYTIVKIAGAVYLICLGVRMFVAAVRGGDAGPDTRRADQTGLWTAFREGLLCNVLNPKAAVFFVALMPQFLPDGASPGDTLALSVIALVITMAWFLGVANFVGALRRVFARPTAHRVIDGLSGTVLVALGIRLAFSARP
ncbi:LysE family translocator [Streptosporangium sp. NPDC004379]|uniref:LysE family translocator n=1 Tax=Streptosporangium sp. NPDC004379 TaxID=3366189 RepID=UPI0036B921C4